MRVEQRIVSSNKACSEERCWNVTRINWVLHNIFYLIPIYMYEFTEICCSFCLKKNIIANTYL